MALRSAAAAAIDFPRRRRRWLLLLAAGGISGYAAYRVYHLPSVARRRQRLANLLAALVAAAEALSSSADAVSLVSSDLSRFLRSDADEIPASLRQLAKAARSEEFSGSVSRVSEALTVGIVRGLRKAELLEVGSPAGAPGFSDRVLDRLFSSSGSGFVSVIAGSFAKNLVIGFYSGGGGGPEFGDRPVPASAQGWVQMVGDDKFREVIADCIQRFVSTAVTVYLDKTMTINAYDQIFSGLTNPKHEAKVKNVLISMCNGAVETVVRTSHSVMTRSSSAASSSASVLRTVKTIPEGEELAPSSSSSSSNLIESSEKTAKDGEGLASRLSSTLAIPTNRKLVLDVTGRVTFETVRSLLEFFLRKLYEAARRFKSMVREEVVERGLDVIRYVTAKSMAIFAICLTFCMQLSIGTRLLMPVVRLLQM